ncbi:group II intron reverse transcriptase/maturase, partial [Parafrankia colletiae]
LARARRRGDPAEVRRVRQRMRNLPSCDPQDPGYRRLRYVRYADDILLGFAGPKAEAEDIKQRLTRFLRDDLRLELSQDKTLVTHARTGAARFLGYEITVQHNDRRVTRGQRHVNGHIGLRVPRSVIREKCAPYLQRGKPARRTQVLHHDDYDIVAAYGTEYRGIVQYYLLAADVNRLGRLRWVMVTSLLKTLASKHRSTVTKMAAKHAATVTTPYGPRACMEAVIERTGRKPLVARFGGIPLRRQKTAVIRDRVPQWFAYPRREVVERLLTGRCELCGSAGDMQVHQIRKLADLGPAGPAQPAWAMLMAQRRRKTLIVCAACHEHTHTGTAPAALTA